MEPQTTQNEQVASPKTLGVQQSYFLFRDEAEGGLRVNINGNDYIVPDVSTACKMADETVSSGNTLHNDAELFVPVKASKTYSVEVFLSFLSPAAEGIKIKFIVPSGATMTWNDLSPDTAKTDSSTLNISTSDATLKSITIHGHLVVGSTAGNLQLQWAKENAGGGNTTVYAGSWLVLSRIS